MKTITKKIEEAIEAYIDGNLSETERIKIENMINNDRDCKEYIDFLQGFKKAAKIVTCREAPSNLTEKIMSNVYSPHTRAQVSIPAYKKWVPITAAAFCSLLIGIFAGRQSAPKQYTDAVAARFLLDAPNARAVAIAGDFTNWKPVTMERLANQWKIVLDVPRGERYQYVFILNGKVMSVDPRAEEMEKDSKGEFYSVLDTRERSTTRL